MEAKLLRAAKALRELNDRLHRASDADRLEIAEEFRQLLASTLEPFDRAIRSLGTGDTADAETAIEFLELRPRFFRSGYTVEKLMRRLARVSLSPALERRFLKAVTDISGEHPSREQKLATLIMSKTET